MWNYRKEIVAYFKYDEFAYYSLEYVDNGKNK